MGRETLQKTVDIAQHTVGLDVIYGDTDSIMINTRINDTEEIAQVTKLGEKVKKEVNKLYRTLELEIDGIFRSMLLLKKKKYAARTVEKVENGKIVKYGQELKGLDLVRRDWCIQSRETGRYVTEQILSGEENEILVSNIYNHLESVATKMRSNELELEKYTITKGLSKHPNDYPDAKSLPHVQVAKMMLKNSRPVNTGDHIPYIITSPPEGGDNEGPRNVKKESAAERAVHPEDVLRSGGTLKPDVTWYLTQQILPPVIRLCESIEAISPKILADKLGIDSSMIQNHQAADAEEEDLLIDYKPASLDSDEERFRDVDKLKLCCLACNTEQEFPGVVYFSNVDKGSFDFVSGLNCTNERCQARLWGTDNHYECYALLRNTVRIWIKEHVTQYYNGEYKCSEPSCQMATRQVSVAGSVCLRHGCTGRLASLRTERNLQIHLKYLVALFDAKHKKQQLEKKLLNVGKVEKRLDLSREIPTNDTIVFSALYRSTFQELESNAYNWISTTFWSSLFKK